jgi:hypothetical protein
VPDSLCAYLMGIGFGLEMTLLLSLFVIPFLVPLALATALRMVGGLAACRSWFSPPTVRKPNA